MLGPANSCVTPPFKAYEAVVAYEALVEVFEYEAVVAYEALTACKT